MELNFYLSVDYYSDGWADRADVVADYERQALGSISIRIHSPYVQEFDKYYFGLNPFKNKRNPWFREFWEVCIKLLMPGGFIVRFYTRSSCISVNRPIFEAVSEL